ncbi:MAG: fused MFS/spermidine synthase, partial [Methylomonas sp.]
GFVTRGFHRFSLTHANSFIACVFLAAYLLFQIEPLIGKYILPWFGGSPAVWTTCMLFFQILLLGGYAYAHLSLNKLNPKQQSWLHIGLLLLALTTLPITPSADWKPADGAQPTWAILVLLLRSVGLPFFVLAATSPLLQAWFARVCPTRSPYPLYALSNLGSLLALLSYPFVFEPYFKLGQQTLGWSVGFSLFVLLCGSLGLYFKHLAQNHAISETPISLDNEVRLVENLSPVVRWLFWLGLPAITSTLLLAVTNQLCQDVASVPFLWILPLAFYLISFVLCFAEFKWYRRSIFIPASLLGGLGLVIALYQGSKIGLEWQISIYSLGLFFCCMICHGELFRLRPQPSQLTAYYLAISVGGAIGGLFVALLSPLIFPLYFEFHIGLFVCFALVFAVLVVENPKPLIVGLGSVILLVLGGHLIAHAYEASAAQSLVSRNFYGVLRVVDRDVEQPEQARRVLRHGAIDHGFQFLAPDKQQKPTAYYRPETGVGLALQHFPKPQRRIGIVGLGVGTLLSYGKADDYFRIYDINPTVVELAQNQFSFIKNTQAQHDIVIADARLALDREASQQFDILVLDAFSGDAIPMHLLTVEAMQQYFRHLQPDGVLVIHIANRHLDLRPLLNGLAQKENYQFKVVHTPSRDDDFGLYKTDWAYLTRNQTFLQHPVISQALDGAEMPNKSVIWTDDFSNLFSLLKTKNKI